MFPAFFDHPAHIQFAQQEPDEKIELMLRQHWVLNIPWIFFSLLGFLAPFGLLFLIDNFAPQYILQVPINTQLGLIIVWYLIVLGYAVESFLHWYYNIYIITNLHLVDINFYNILNRSITESGIEDVEGASTDMKGILRSLFHFGNVLVETAAERQVFTFTDVPHPDIVADRIQDLRRIASVGERSPGE